MHPSKKCRYGIMTAVLVAVAVTYLTIAVWALTAKEWGLAVVFTLVPVVGARLLWKEYVSDPHALANKRRPYK